MKTIGLTLLAAGLLCFTASPQEKPATKKKSADAGMSMPKPAAEMKELRALVGTWSSDETFEPSPFMPGGTATGTNTDVWVPAVSPFSWSSVPRAPP